MAETSHKCFGCQRQINDMEPHIHVGLEEWGMQQGLESLGLGLDDLLTFPFCQSCTEKSERGWTLEQHVIAPDSGPQGEGEHG